MIRSLFKSHPVFFAVLLMFITLSPVMFLRDVSPSNELRYLSIVDEAIQNGNAFAFTNHGEDYADKPPLYFWLAMLSRLIFGEHCIYALWFLAFIPAMAIIGVLDKWLRHLSAMTTLKFSPEERFAVALMTGTSALYLGSYMVLRMDMLMCMFIILALYTFYKMYKGIGHPGVNSFLLPFYIFMALFSKGPVGLLMPIVCIFFSLLIMGKIRDVGRYLGWKTWLVLLLFSGAWLLGVWLEGGEDYLYNLLFHQTIDRAVDAEYHKEPVWFYFPVLLYALAPYSLLTIVYFFKSFSSKGFVTDAEKILTTSIVTTVIMLSCFSSKLSIYLLPVFPLMTYLFVIVNKRNNWGAGVSVTLWIPAVVLFILGVAAAAVPFLIDRLDILSPLQDYSFVRSPLVFGSAAALMIFNAVSMHSLVKKSWTGAVAGIGLSLLLSAFVASPLTPQINDYIGYGNLCSAAKEVSEKEGLSGYVTIKIGRSENMDVYMGEDVRVLNDSIYTFLTHDYDGKVLMLKHSTLEKSAELSESLAGRERARVGDYSVWSLKDFRPEEPNRPAHPKDLFWPVGIVPLTLEE